MERNRRDNYGYGHGPYQNDDQYQDPSRHRNDWHGREFTQDPRHLHQYPHQQRVEAELRHQPNHDQGEYPAHHYRQDQHGRYPYQQNHSQDYDRFGQRYQDDFRHDPTLRRGSKDDDLMGNIRQGYGISSYDGTSDRFNTLNSEQRYGTQQDEQAYFSGDRDGYNRAQFGGGIGDSGLNSNRGIPNYGIHNFGDGEGSGLGSSYGGTNYGGGRGYTGGHQGGTWGDNSYGTTSGNFGGYGPMGGSTYGGGRGSYGDTSSSQNSSRGSNEVGGF